MVGPMFECIMGNGHMGTPCGQNDGQTSVKTLPSCNFVGGNKFEHGGECPCTMRSQVNQFEHVRWAGVWGPVQGGRLCRCSVQPPEQNDTHTHTQLKTLPSRNFVGGR